MKDLFYKFLRYFSKYYINKKYKNIEIHFYSYAKEQSINLTPAIIISYNKTWVKEKHLFELDICWIFFCFSIIIK